MHIILSRVIWRGGEMMTAIAQHMPSNVPWSDQVSGDGFTVASIVLGDIPAEALAAIKADRDVLDYLYIADPGAPLPAGDAAKVQSSAARHDIPTDAMPATPTGNDVAEAVKRRMLLSQVLRESNFDTSDKLEAATIERMKKEGFYTDEVNPGDDKETRIRKVQKKRHPGG